MPKRELITLDAFRADARAGTRRDVGVMRASSGTPQPGDEETRTIRFVYSDGSIDRAGDTISPKGWDLKDYLANPVALWAHCSWDPPIGKSSNVGVEGDKLIGDISFATRDEYALADTIYRLVKGGYINACSVGFIPHEWVFTSDKNRPYGIDFTKQELLEISPCPVPCNANALVEARSQGVDTAPIVAWAERVLDGGNTILVPKAELEQLRKAADATGRTTSRPAKSETATWECAADRELPIDDKDSWDAAAAEARIFTWAGFDGDSPDPDKAKRAFLAFDSANPTLKGSYKLPIADYDDGTLEAVAGAIRNAASRLPQTEGLPAEVSTMARAVLDHYEAQMKDGKTADPADDSTDPVMPTGNCGRLPADACGMGDPMECVVHATGGKTALAATHKAGRALSAKNEADLRSAVELIQGVLAAVDPASGDEGGTDDGGKAARLRHARALQLGIV